MADLYMKMHSMSLTIIEMQVKTTMRHHLTPVRMAIIKKISVLVRMWRKGTPLPCWLECKLVQSLCKII